MLAALLALVLPAIGWAQTAAPNVAAASDLQFALTEIAARVRGATRGRT